jgi:type II secretion system protein E
VGLMEDENKNIYTSLIGSIFFNKGIIKLVESMIEFAILNKASDIHCRDVNGEIFLEYRIVGKLYKLNIPKNISSSELISRIKILSKLNVAEKRMPQDGSFTYTYNGNSYDIRVAILPTIMGESIVLRILNNMLEDVSLKALGYSEDKIKILNKLCRMNHGLILVTGATGSGKSTTLLSLINILNDGNRKIISIEDPVENKLKDIVQIQVKEEIGLSFSNILRTVLRSDPDVIVIGEIRDELTADITVRAALTGHLVLATLHTTDAVGSFSRLIDMGIPRYLLLDSILCILSQKLLRDEKKNERVCINELLELNDDIIDILNRNNNENEIKKRLKQLGYVSIEDIENKMYN